MIPANSLMRISWRTNVEGVQCVNRLFFTNAVAFEESTFAAEAAVVQGPILDFFRSLISVEAVVSESVCDLPEIPNVPPIVFGNAAAGARLGASYPAHIYAQLNFWGDLTGTERLRNSMKISGLSVIDFRENHAIINWYSSVNFFFVYLRDTINMGIAAQFRHACARRIAATDWEFRSTKFHQVTTDLKSLKSRQR